MANNCVKITSTAGISAAGGLSAGKTSYFADKIGIGTNYPNTILHLSKSSSTQGATLRIDNPATTNNSCVGIEFVNSTTGVPRSAIMAQRVDSGYNPELVFYTSPTNSLQERMRIDHDGNVGIGTSTPNASLAVVGDTTITGNLSVTGDVTCLDTVIAVTSALSVINAGTGPALYVEQDGLQPIAHFVDRNGDDIVFDDNGKVGIGTCNPTTKLHVSGGDASFVDGNVGIGTTSPARDLSIVGSGANALLQIANCDTGSTSDNGLDFYV